MDAYNINANILSPHSYYKHNETPSALLQFCKASKYKYLLGIVKRKIGLYDNCDSDDNLFDVLINVKDLNFKLLYSLYNSSHYFINNFSSLI